MCALVFIIKLQFWHWMHSILTCQSYQVITKIPHSHVLKVQIQKTAGTMSMSIQIVALSISIFFSNYDSNSLSTKLTKWFRWEDVNRCTITNKKSDTVFELYTYTKTVVDAYFFLIVLSKENNQNNMNLIKFKHRRKTHMLWFWKWIMQKITHVEHKMKCSQPIGIKPRWHYTLLFCGSETRSFHMSL